MIVFDGITLDSVAPVAVEDIRVSPIRYNPVVRPRAIRFGSEFVRMGGGERTITVSLAVLDKNKITRHEAFMNLSAWAKTDKEYKLELPTDPTRYLFCVCTAKPEPSARAWWENKLKLVFTCYENPYWTSKQEKSVAVGTEFTVYGNAPPLMQIRRTWAASAYGIGYTLDGRTISLTNVTTGAMVIDLNKQTIAIGGSSIMDKFTPNSQFLVPRVGTQTITGSGGLSNYGTVKYRERWE